MNNHGRVLTVTIGIQDDNYGPDDPRLFCSDDPDMDVTVTLPGHAWRNMGCPVEISVQVVPTMVGVANDA